MHSNLHAGLSILIGQCSSASLELMDQRTSYQADAAVLSQVPTSVCTIRRQKILRHSAARKFFMDERPRDYACGSTLRVDFWKDH
ncbi:hypothetical protein BS78_05G122400 [Paspalum vaginatum]|nr:hypothetical protein BS78_05G122400 [Paspalum vaginatum]